jgi:hypothetical protein
VKAITVHQPWAWAIAFGGKDVENRRRTLGPYTGRLALHAGALWSSVGAADPRVAQAWLDRHGVAFPDEALVPAGVVFAVVDLVGTHVVERGCCTSPWADTHYANRLIGAHLELANPRVLERPVAARGQLGLWNLRGAAEAAVLAQLGEAA